MFKCELMFSNQSSYLGAVSILGYYLHPAGRVDVSAGLGIFAGVPGEAGPLPPPAHHLTLQKILPTLSTNCRARADWGRGGGCRRVVIITSTKLAIISWGCVSYLNGVGV